MSKIWYSKNNILSRNCVMNFILGGRGIGKTYAFKEWAIKDYIKNGKKAVLVRRFKEEISDKFMSEFMVDIKDNFPQYKFDIYQKNIRIDKEPFIKIIPLSTANFVKSVPMPEVNKLIFDEFLLEKGPTKYLQNEVFALLNLVNTICRLRPKGSKINDDLRVFLLANVVSYVNQYFDYFNITPPTPFGIKSNGFWAVELANSEEYKKEYDQTRWGIGLKGTSYYDYAVGNTPYMDESPFIQNFSHENMEFIACVTLNHDTVGCWLGTDFKLYFSHSYPSTNYNYVINAEDHSPNTLWVKNFKKLSFIKQLINNYSTGQIVYKDSKIFHVMSEFFRYLC